MTGVHSRELQEYKHLPYTVIAHTSLITQYSIFLTGDGMKKIVEQMREGEDLKITIIDKEYAKFEIVDTHNKYPKQPQPKLLKRKQK